MLVYTLGAADRELDEPPATVPQGPSVRRAKRRHDSGRGAVRVVRLSRILAFRRCHQRIDHTESAQ